MLHDKNQFEKLILASTSVYRQALLRRLGISFEAVPPPMDESALKETLGNIAPQKLAEALALAKAESVYQDLLHKDPRTASLSLVIGGDQLVAFEGQILGKSKTREKAVEQLRALSGKTHQLVTSVALVPAGIVFTEIVEIRLKKLSMEQIKKYVDADNPVDCAGSYKIEKHGIALMEEVKAHDFTSIEGLPLIRLSTELARLGLPVF